MGHVERLLQNFDRFVSLPWDKHLAGAQKIWFAVYDKAEERRLRFRLPEFEHATMKAGHPWIAEDVVDYFPQWLASHEYAESYFHDPSALEPALDDFKDYVTERLKLILTGAGETHLGGVYGVGGLFGFMKVSELMARLETHIRGRLLVFFPGAHEGNTYRLLDARPGWNYLAVPLTADEPSLKA
jgi:hypothetical protein